MKIIDQHKLVHDLKDLAGKMSREDRYDFEMIQKRDKDDEELDELSYSKLEAMHKRYVVRKTKKDIEDLFRKTTSQPPEKKE
jgi:hypothetical protein